MSRVVFLCLTIIGTGVFENAHGAAIITFSNGDQLEGEKIGDMAMYTDTVSSITGTLTTRGFTNTAGASTPGASLNPNDGTLGVNAAGGSGSSFDNNESWTFDWNVKSSLVEFDVGTFTTADGERFVLQSDDWKGLVGVTPGAPGSVTYNSVAGSFTLTDKDSSDVFSLNDITGGVALDIAAGIGITIGYANNTGASTAHVEGMSFTFSAVPEPSGVAIIVGCCITAIGVRRRRR